MDTIKFTDKYGTRRKGIKKVCTVCQKEFITRIDQPNETCSAKCRGELKSQNNRVSVKCAWCKKKFTKIKSHLRNSKSGLYFCSANCKNKASKLDGGIKEVMPSHYGTAEETKYREQFSEPELYCRRCGYNEFSCGVDVHHVDENRKNANKQNLIPLCSPCHRALHHDFWKLEELGT